MKYGFIGCGNMGGAIARAMSQGTDDMLLSSLSGLTAMQLAAELNAESGTNTEVAEQCDYIFLGVKPHMIRGVITELKDILLSRRPVLVSMAAGITVKTITDCLDADYPVVRIMPNTPCAIGCGVILCCRNSLVTDAEYQTFKDAMAAAGSLIDLRESLIDAGSAISGCGPAYVYTFIEAMADAGVACGLTRADALSLAASTVSGAAAMVTESGTHPARLRDQVCSPGGSTIAGVLSLENDGFRAAVSNCVLAAFDRTKELGKQ